MNWSRHLAWAAWMLFVLSFFLPAYEDGQGWNCAYCSARGVYELYSDRSNFQDIKTVWEHRADFHLASLTFANLFMIFSPFLFAMVARKKHLSKWLQLFSFASFGAVGSFFLLLGEYGLRRDVRIGYYVWTTSFLLLFLSALLRRNQDTKGTNIHELPALGVN